MANEKETKLALPVGELLIFPLKGIEGFCADVDKYIVERRSEETQYFRYEGFRKESYIGNVEISRFGTGEAKATLHETVRGKDVFIIVDVTNHSQTYSMYGTLNRMSPDDYYADLKRTIAAMMGKAKRINVIMPFLYESRQHKRSGRESLDCAVMLQELKTFGVDNIITFDAHDPRVMNAIPLASFDNITCTFQFVQAMLETIKDFDIDEEHMMVISPDEGATARSIYYSSILGINMGMFYKRRDYTKVVNGKNPIVAHEFLGADVAGKDVIIIDDMIASGDSLIDTAKDLKERKARRVFACCTFGLFTAGVDNFNEAYKDGIIDGIFTTNLIYQIPELSNCKWYHSVDLTKFLAYIIDSLNQDISLSPLLNPLDRVRKTVEEYKKTRNAEKNVLFKD